MFYVVAVSLSLYRYTYDIRIARHARRIAIFTVWIYIDRHAPRRVLAAICTHVDMDRGREERETQSICLVLIVFSGA